MHNKRGLPLTIAALAVMVCVMSFVLAGCGDEKQDMEDGYYTAVQKVPEHGWTEYVTINVKNDRILTVEFQATNESGFVKSWDLDYMRIMKVSNGTYPNEYVRILSQEFLEAQNPNIDGVTGATTSTTNFLKLTTAVIEQAKKGDTDVIVVDTGNPEEDG
jgi:major membrane immunogen (membrane-anchored lipoprotein)